MKTQPSGAHLAKMTLFFGTLMVLIITALTAFWLNRVIFDTDRFTSITVSAFSEESSRESVGNLIAERVFENRPLLRANLSEPLSNYIASFLATDTAQSGIERAAREAQLLFTSPRREPVVLELAEYKAIIATAQELVRPDESERRLNVEDIPDSITLIDTNQLPNFHQTAIVTHIVGPLSLIAALALAGAWLIQGKRINLYKRSRILLLVVIASAIVAALIGPIVEPIFISVGSNAPSQTLLANFYTAFITPYLNQALWLGAIAALALVGLTAWRELTKRYSPKLELKKK
jgi:hypothetical protein